MTEETWGEQSLDERKEKIVSFLKEKKDWIVYILLAVIIFIGTWIRTLNVSKLKDITTGTWTLGPDLDPFLFLRWAKDIVTNGSLMQVDMMRYVPLGYNTAGEMKLLAYMIAWFHNFLSFFSSKITVTYSAVWFPVFMFALTAIAFFLFARKIFYKESKIFRNSVGLIATAFFVVVPSLLPRTIAGIPEKESAGFLFIFLAFYFLIESFTSEKNLRSFIFAGLAGISTGMLGMIWGGVTYVFMTVAGAVLLAFLLGKIEEKEFYSFCIWIVGFVIVMLPFSERYSISNLLFSTSTGISFAVLLIILVNILIFKKKLFGLGDNLKRRIKLPSPIITLIVSVILLLILLTLFKGPSFIYEQITDVVSQTIHPLDVSRFGLTVAENKQPFFINDWKESFGPVLWNIPLFFWMLFIGSAVLFNRMIRKLGKKENLILTSAYVIFLAGIIFSKYSASGSLNGDTGISLLVYFGGIILFLGSFAYYYYQRYKKGEFLVFREFGFEYILYFVVFTMALVGARGAIRLVMVLGAISPVAVAFLVVKSAEKYVREKEDTKKLIIGIFALLLILASMFTLWNYYQQDRAVSENFAPGSYQWQWQNAMSWVRDNTPEDSVFAHWWDYGYWVQSIGERATIIDGGNSITYWNYLMGRYVLTGTSDRGALEFLYTHDATHLLIDSTEIGKYPAFSSIGSDEDYDRYSWISTFLLDESQTQETKDSTTYVYPGGFTLDEDVVWNVDGKDVLLPRRGAGVGGIIIKKTGEEFSQPNGFFVYNGKQYIIPLRYSYINGERTDFGTGIDAGVFFFPQLKQTADNGLQISNLGAALYLSKRTVHSRIAELYLFGQDSEYFKLKRTESSILVGNLRNQNIDVGEFVYYGGFQGPIKIWEISYPTGMKINEEYLNPKYPNPEIQIAKEGEY